MSHRLFCEKLKQEELGLTAPPFAGELGERIYQHISKKAWDMWIQQQTILINEYRLSTIDPKARQFLREELQKFLFES